ncbi:hypothetical protein COW36_04610 [bacterium (Candidatus Blackallbacteria) CG17_big_fil_post_rev_8_21_14_2_50_48_46]|uniref:Galactosyldiacylglycerol synthase n=1 Tax=bacterium (Candidatus Blackallbacteria) CG17_big_fil_post_rev_8_21_14_2_50_48_46 TaxID=2014261 RepID=A0A2M7G8Z0_9BACT|nr:MAG: hypothetical protein COW64_04335 [bacterium (Candidatus Blackallbacteria) CG18_big_fil_WC_8_21_14_2_50_49_26]PIW18578.1 MAG: hypothetical protein COW36_04610 [bacterium (Candidatus Blackallbacteria) CG17_big_fil_post_rev_8_21_14_2_50_48_46]PIW46437.1 MAG: hypothetical protein COW20_16070 [bacterium (Candidatus Blackallbacteria) CG13_big_fil_rev_8_21_14_2_50_49_14]
MQINHSSTGSLTSEAMSKITPGASKPRVVFIVCEAGGGHHSAARAITQALHHAYPHQFDTVTVNVEDMIGPFGRFLGTVYVGSYNLALQHGHYWLEPWIFGSLSGSRTSLLPFGVPHFRKALAKLKPDMVVMLIHGAHEVMNATLQRDGYIPNLTVVTDAVTIRDSWVHPYCDQIIVSTPEAREACIQHGVEAQKIEILGHPMDIRFSQPLPPREVLRKQYGLAADRFTLLIMMGGSGGKNILRFSEMIAASQLPVQVLAICGKDQKLFQQMQEFASQAPIPIHPFGFTTEVPSLMSISDAVITKPGPGTIMEAMACDLPIILDDSNYTMYQEKGNVDFIRDNGIGTVIDESSELIPAIRNLIENPAAYQAMRENIRKNKRVDAGLRVAEQIHTRLAHPARMWHQE